MTKAKNKAPEFIESDSLDPMAVATRGQRQSRKSSSIEEKKKAGFYLAVSLLERFDRKFYQLKLEGAAIDNKSQLLETALTFALDDIDKGKKSSVLKKIAKN